jgi:hypothetical protein
MAITAAQFKKVALSFPEAHEKSHYGSPSIMIAKKFFTRLRREDDGIVWIVGSIDERDALLEMDPQTYFITDHYRNYPAVLVRISAIDTAMLRKMLERRWRAIAPKKLFSSSVYGGGAERRAVLDVQKAKKKVTPTRGSGRKAPERKR